MSRELPELILATLSAGPVGVGDALGRIDASNLKRAMRTDSVLLKPDVPVQPIDASILSDAESPGAPMVAATRSGEELEVFAYPRANSQHQATVSLSQLDIRGPAYEWDWVRGTGRLIPAGGTFAMVFRNGWAYSVVTPVGEDDMGILGDTEAIVPLARERFPAVRNSTDAKVAVAFAPGEDAVMLSGYAARRPTVQASHGSIDSLQYAAATRLFRVTVHPAAGEAAVRTVDLLIREGAVSRR